MEDEMLDIDNIKFSVRADLDILALIEEIEDEWREKHADEYKRFYDITEADLNLVLR